MVAATLRRWWTRHGYVLLAIVAAYMAVTAFFRLRYGFAALTVLGGSNDLHFRYIEVQHWFAGLPVYRVVEHGDYPPASYAMLWPLLGWVSFAHAKWIWAVTSAAALGLLAYQGVRESGAATWSDRAFVALLPFPLYATQLTVWLGQLGLHVLVLALGGLLLLRRDRESWRADGLAAVLLVLSLLKPQLAVPFVVLAVIVAPTARPAVLVVGGYVLLTLFATSFQEPGLVSLVRDWHIHTGENVDVRGGQANVHRLLGLLGLGGVKLPASIGILAAFGLWAYRFRRCDFWIIVGVTALVARLWIHHQSHDDVIILLAMIALFRLARAVPLAPNADLMAAGLLAGLVLANVAPYWLAATWPASHAPAWLFPGGTPAVAASLYEIGQAVLWLAALGYLLWQATLHDEVSGDRQALRLRQHLAGRPSASITTT